MDNDILIYEEKIQEIEKKQNELRDQRDKLYEVSQDIQKEIDNLEIEKYNTKFFIGKVIDLSIMSDKLNTYDVIEYFYVTDIKRLYRGPEFIGVDIAIYKNPEGVITSIEIENDVTMSKYTWLNVKNIKTVENIDDMIKTIKESLNTIDMGTIFNKIKE